MYSTLISVEQLDKIIDSAELVIVDCRYDLANPDKGREQFSDEHILGAQFVDVHDDLSGPPLTDCGRHPLPSPDALNKLFSRLGITQEFQVIVYDASNGAFAARLWWLLRYMGHQAVAVLDGGWQEWKRLSKPTSHELKSVAESAYVGEPNTAWLRLLNDIPDAELLIDSREPPRYRGEYEPIDPVAGHIPGAKNHFWQHNLTDTGLFKRPEQLRAQFESLFSDKTSEQAVFYCGSGVTACHNLLAVSHAGLPPANLYAGSWSEWCSDPSRTFAVDND